MLKRLLKYFIKPDPDPEPQIKNIVYEYCGDVMDVSDMKHGEIMIYNGEHDWMGFKWENHKIVSILVPWATVPAIDFPHPGLIIKAKPKKLGRQSQYTH